MEKNTIKPANAVHITMAIAMPRIFVEFFLMSLLDISFADAQSFAERGAGACLDRLDYQVWTLLGGRKNSKPGKGRRIPSVHTMLCWAAVRVRSLFLWYLSSKTLITILPKESPIPFE